MNSDYKILSATLDTNFWGCGAEIWEGLLLESICQDVCRGGGGSLGGCCGMLGKVSYGRQRGECMYKLYC